MSKSSEQRWKKAAKEWWLLNMDVERIFDLAEAIPENVAQKRITKAAQDVIDSVEQYNSDLDGAALMVLIDAGYLAGPVAAFEVFVEGLKALAELNVQSHGTADAL